MISLGSIKRMDPLAFVSEIHYHTIETILALTTRWPTHSGFLHSTMIMRLKHENILNHYNKMGVYLN